LSKFKEIEKELAQLRSAAAMADISKFAAGAKKIDGATVTSVRIPDGIAVDDLRKIALELRNRDADSVVVLISVVDGKPVLVVAASDAARSRGVKAGALVKIGSTVLGGGGGGKDDFAQGGGTNVGAIDQALQAIELAISGK
jgi:alanyl-tRNA synthetase